MAEKVKVIVLRTAGTNCDQETVFAFREVGAEVDLVHINELFNRQKKLESYHILALPGGFTYGDDIAAGRILANELRIKLGEDIKKFISDGKLIIGICNGFQVMIKSGILPGSSESEESGNNGFIQKATLMTNDSNKFEDRWVYLRSNGRCIWTEGIDDIVYFPVAHAEGKFVPKDKRVLNGLKENNQVTFRYCTQDGKEPIYPQNPNGSVDDIAGISDKSGRIFGLMPHPERYFLHTQHPFWTRLKKKSKFGYGAKIFQNGVDYVKKNLV